MLGSRRFRLWAVPAVALVITFAALAWFSPMLSVREVRIEGAAGAIPEDQVRELLQIPDRGSILRIDTAAMAQRVASIPKVRSARVQRVLPSTVRVRIEPRTPVLYYDTAEGAHLLDADGIEYAIEPAPIGVPKLETEKPGSADALTRAAVSVVRVLPPELTAQVDSVHAETVSDISLTLRDGRTVLWGSSEDGERKSAVVLPLLTRPGSVFDVSSPSLVTVK
ncbi:FtsQ-type POTRA domain-containing protein [Nocardia speluncae]|uniref:FtsQ-type POTRA domain-containing protein n=2 Tax=Nocardia speluncae TaxID=419477 RepID=A0A846XM08_9NOCA|nr:FtsQ-type POTRA domain-containing protein [Nocardia speluncae]NKY36627.1 FtsQ-type POTRA domain-containing protein [Nocardia speluncae]